LVVTVLAQAKKRERRVTSLTFPISFFSVSLIVCPSLGERGKKKKKTPPPRRRLQGRSLYPGSDMRIERKRETIATFRSIFCSREEGEGGEKRENQPRVFGIASGEKRVTSFYSFFDYLPWNKRKKKKKKRKRGERGGAFSPLFAQHRSSRRVERGKGEGGGNRDIT